MALWAPSEWPGHVAGPRKQCRPTDFRQSPFRESGPKVPSTLRAAALCPGLLQRRAASTQPFVSSAAATPAAWPFSALPPPPPLREPVRPRLQVAAAAAGRPAVAGSGAAATDPGVSGQRRRRYGSSECAGFRQAPQQRGRRERVAARGSGQLGFAFAASAVDRASAGDASAADSLSRRGGFSRQARRRRPVCVAPASWRHAAGRCQGQALPAALGVGAGHS